jgi:hypothetical protein
MEGIGCEGCLPSMSISVPSCRNGSVHHMCVLSGDAEISIYLKRVESLYELRIDLLEGLMIQ